MTSRKRDVGRTRWALELADKAENILSSEKTSRTEKANFIQAYSWTRASGSWPDDMRTDLMALVVLDDFPVETLNEILRVNIEEAEEPILWLADTYYTIPDHDPKDPAAKGTLSVQDDWLSPFIGSSVEDVAAFIQSTPKPPKPLSKRFFAVLRKELYEQNKQVLIYHIAEKIRDNADGSELQSVPCPVHLAGVFFYGFDRHDWKRAVREQALHYGEGATWSDDDESDQLMALIVLGDIPTATISRILDDNNDRAEHPYLWLADVYSNLPDYRPNYRIDGIDGPVNPSWRSPFVGKSIEDAANFVRDAPKPPKPLCKRFFAVLQKDNFDHSITLLICKIVPDHDSDLESEMSEEGRNAYAGVKEEMTSRIRDAGNSIICNSATDDSEFEVQIQEFPIDYAGMFFAEGNRHEWEQGLL